MRSIAVGIVAGFVWKIGYADPKRRQYEEFYKNYDAVKVAKEMYLESQAAEQS